MEKRSDSRPTVTKDNVSAAVQAVAWLLLAAMFLATALRLLTRLYTLRRCRRDDILVATAFIFALGQTVTLLVPASSIWGHTLQQIDTKALNSGIKAQYAGWLLFVPSITFAKLSILVGLLAITPVESHRRSLYISGLVIAIFAVSSEICLIFQCGAPDSWDYISRSCLNRESLQLYIGVLNIITDASLIIIPVAIIAPIRMALQKRVTIVTLFASRLLVIAATATQLSYLHRSFDTDFTFDSFPYIICTQIVEALSVITACIPYLQPFLESLNTGLLTADVKGQTQASSASATLFTGSYDPSAKDRREYTNIETQPGLLEEDTELKTLRDKFEMRTSAA